MPNLTRTHRSLIEFISQEKADIQKDIQVLVRQLESVQADLADAQREFNQYPADEDMAGMSHQELVAECERGGVSLADNLLPEEDDQAVAAGPAVVAFHRGDL